MGESSSFIVVESREYWKPEALVSQGSRVTLAIQKGLSAKFVSVSIRVVAKQIKILNQVVRIKEQTTTYRFAYGESTIF